MGFLITAIAAAVGAVVGLLAGLAIGLALYGDGGAADTPALVGMVFGGVLLGLVASRPFAKPS